MARGRKLKINKKTIDQYEHIEAERFNNPPVGLVSPESDVVVKKNQYSYDYHLDPQLVWSGKAERTSFKVDTVSLHVHERIESKTIIQAVKTKNGFQQTGLGSFFSSPGENPPFRDAVEFYQHKHGWSNRLIAGDSLLVMNSLLEKEGMRGQVQMIYIDPPYGIKYGSNFQPFVNKRDVKDGKDEDLTQEPEMIKAFRDTWELGIHSYLTSLRDRFLLARDLLTNTGSLFVQISEENVHHVREVLDEIFGKSNFISIIYFATTGGFATTALSRIGDYLLWYCKDKNQLKYHQLYSEKGLREGGGWSHSRVEYEDGRRENIGVDSVRKLLSEGKKIRPYSLDGLSSQGLSNTGSEPFNFEGRLYKLPPNSHWKTSLSGMNRLVSLKRIEASTNSIRFVRFLDDFPVQPITNIWDDTNRPGYIDEKKFVVQTSSKVIERCILMTTDPGDLVFDPTCGSGTTAFVAELLGRRWITCDTSRVAITLAKQRLMTALFDYYKLAYPKEGIQSGFSYKTVQHISLKSLAKNEPPEMVTLFDQREIDNSRVRVTGPFTVEAVPAPYVKPVDEVPSELDADQSVSHAGETLRQGEWRSEIIKSGIRGKGGQSIEFSRIEPLSGTQWLHADAETKEVEPKRVIISFGPDYAPLEQKQVELALEEASHLFPKPKIMVFAAFQFDPEAAKDIDEANLPGVTLLKVQMNADLLTNDLKKKRISDQSFWLIGQPDVEIHKLDEEKVTVEVKGFDYYNTRTGELESGGSSKIALWMLDSDYDYRSLFPRQVFFPMAGEDEGWSRLARNLKAEIDPELIEHYRGTESLPFKPGNAIAIKIIDDRGIESLKIIRM